jgi:uncharacterized protein YegJ (DUF2314 family)
MRPMIMIRLALLLVAVCIGIYRGYSRSSSSSTRRITPSGETAYGRNANDSQLEAAAETARAQWPDFVAELNQHKADESFSVKVPLATKRGGEEHIWVKVTAIEGETIRGNLANEPFEDVGYKNGDPLSIQSNIVEDWLISKDGKPVRGGFSVEVLRKGK